MRTVNYYKNCILCPRSCGADRRRLSAAGSFASDRRRLSATGSFASNRLDDQSAAFGRRPGFCGCPDHIRAALGALHYYEEPFLSGLNGSGAVFFSGCNLRCVYCQNHTISGDDSFGVDITPARLAEVFLELQSIGAHNINLVTGTPYIPDIADALRLVREDGSLKIPVIWNSSGYERVESLQLLEGLVDIWLPDLKTLSPSLASRYMKAPDYPEAAKKAIEYMVAVSGPARFTEFKATSSVPSATAGQDPSSPSSSPSTSPPSSQSMFPSSTPSSAPAYSAEDVEESGLMVSGVCVRHLVIPGQTEDSKKVLEYLYNTFGDDIWISLMSQYTPMRTDFIQEELNRTVSAEEYDEVIGFAEELGIENCMIQMEGAASESFIPRFDGRGLVSGSLIPGSS